MPKPVEVHGATPVRREHHDRFAWRARLKAHPVTRAWFRFAVAVVGALFMLAAVVSGPLPGPGGIPLFLTGLAILATEFHWARRFKTRLLRYLRVYLGWPPARKRNFWIAVFVALGILGWGYLAVLGVPAWLPEWLAAWLRRLPWVS